MSARWRAPGPAGVAQRRCQGIEIEGESGGQDKKHDVWDHLHPVVALFLKALRRPAAMCGASPAMWTLHRFPLFARPCRTSRGWRP
jgi:hypothetical protein